MDDKFSEIRQFLFDMSLCDLLDTSQNKDASKIGYYLVRQQMTRIVIRSLISQENSEHTSVILDILSETEYEVRLVCLEMLIDFFNSSKDNKETW